MPDGLTELILALCAEDLREQRRVSREILAAGSAALPRLVDALAEEGPSVRRSAAYLLGMFKSDPKPLAALCRALTEDPEPKVRKNAAVSLGKYGSDEAVDALAEAAGREEVAWVRPSYPLALGAIGGERALAALRNLEPRDDAEGEAVRKALDRCQGRRGGVSWRDDSGTLPLRLSVPAGLERVASGEAKEKGFGLAAAEAPGLLIPKPGIPPWELIRTLRCIEGVRIDAGSGPALDAESPGSMAAQVAGLIRESGVLRRWPQWLESEESRIRYRFSLEGRALRRDALRALLESVREAAVPLDLIDSPSHYDVELIVRDDGETARLFIVPSFMADDRFAYRLRDVGASIRPAVGAGLARLSLGRSGGFVFDPTCGSGTVLIERALAEPEARLVGWDISRTAVKAARENVEAAGLRERIEISEGDAMKTGEWPACDVVLANLPFGMRTRRESLDLERLYGSVIDGTALHLRAGGRAVLYTANRKLLESCLTRSAGRVKVRERLKIHAGGLWCGAWVMSGRG